MKTCTETHRLGFVTRPKTESMLPYTVLTAGRQTVLAGAYIFKSKKKFFFIY